MAESFGVPFIGRVPIEPALARACEAGLRALPGSSDVMAPIVERILRQTKMLGEATAATVAMADK
eukprot:scaffold112987_cov28-Tisochrysis_lutea.AAC.3